MICLRPNQLMISYGKLCYDILVIALVITYWDVKMAMLKYKSQRLSLYTLWSGF
jgi:hypothetical protein